MDVKRGFGLTGGDTKKDTPKGHGVYISDGRGGFIPMDDYMNDMKSLDIDEFLHKYPLEGVEIPGDPNYAKQNKSKLSKEQIDKLYKLVEAIDNLQVGTSASKETSDSKQKSFKSIESKRKEQYGGKQPAKRATPTTERDKQLEKEREQWLNRKSK